MASRRMYDEPPGLVDDDDVLIFVEHVEQDVGIGL
jgi:hypothetical protein